jgi:cytoskeleton protein RodZ
MIGESLRKARTGRGLTLVEASEAIKIRVRYLRALEAEDWDVMPARAYARGFLRTYADYLGLDGEALVEDFRRTVEPPAPETRAPERPAPVPGIGGRRPIGWGAVAALAVVAVAAIIFVLGITGGGGGNGGRTANGTKRAHHRHHHHRAHHGTSKPKPKPTPTEASIELHPTGTVWVCLVDQSGKPLVNGETLSAGQSRGPFRGPGFEVNLGNGAVQIRADGRDVGVPDSPNPLGYRVSPDGVSALGPTSRPTCA